MVTVVDCANLLKDYSSKDSLKDRGEVAGEGDERTIVDLLVEQIEFANVILLNKTDLVNGEELNTVRAIVRGLNARAKIIETQQSKVDLSEVLNTRLFNLEEAQEHPLWAQELYHPEQHKPETLEYGIHSFVYRNPRPFDPKKFYEFIQSDWENVVRAKGFFWLANRPDYVGELSQAGVFARHQGIGRWWCAIPKNKWPDTPEFEDLIKRYWTKDYGDRRQELVFIGVNMDEEGLRKRLDSCLYEGDFKDAQSVSALEDPFPQWFKTVA